MSFTKSLFLGQCALLVLMVLLVISYRFRLLPFKPAFGGFALSALIVSVIAIIALVIVLLSFGVIAKEMRPMASGAFVLGVLPLIVMALTVGKGFKVPRIHDISTNTGANIEFVHAKKRRGPSENSIDLPDDSVIKQQQSYYPHIVPLENALPPEQAYAKSLEVASELGWDVVHEDVLARQFEAVDRTAIFGFADDIVVRVSAAGTGSVVDMRSVSRVGVSDLGANAKRIERFQMLYDEMQK